MRRLFPLFVCVLFALNCFTAFAQEAGSVVDTAAADPELTTFVSALDATGLLTTLAGNGPYTLFAPTDTAFSTLLGALDVSAEDLFANTEVLSNLLLYHVVAGEVPSNALVVSTTLATLNGSEIAVST